MNCKIYSYNLLVNVAARSELLAAWQAEKFRHLISLF